jgi:hypothetical protein
MIDNNSWGNLFDSLSEDEQKELLISYKESFDENNLLRHDEVKLQHEKWLKADHKTP